MAEQTKRKKWSDVKARLEAFDRTGLVSLLGDLYDASAANRRFLHSRLTHGSRAIEEYRRLVADAIYPDPFSKRRVSVPDLGYGDEAYFNALQIRPAAVAKEFDPFDDVIHALGARADLSQPRQRSTLIAT